MPQLVWLFICAGLLVAVAAAAGGEVLGRWLAGPTPARPQVREEPLERVVELADGWALSVWQDRTRCESLTAAAFLASAIGAAGVVIYSMLAIWGWQVGIGYVGSLIFNAHAWSLFSRLRVSSEEKRQIGMAANQWVAELEAERDRPRPIQAAT
jgi:hypothetical protein